MKARELIEKINAGIDVGSVTCDTVKAGDVEKEVGRVAVTMFATVDTVKAAAAWGADMLIVHEPTYYDHMEVRDESDPVVQAKESLIAQTGMVVYRFHDHPHRMAPDMIGEGVLKALGMWEGYRGTPSFGCHRVVLDAPVTARDIARHAEKEMGLGHVRVAGAMDIPSTRLIAAFGTPGKVFDWLRDPEVDIVITGEACEWQLAEYARDAAQLGMNKSLLVFGHIGSERDGMKLLAERLREDGNLTVRYFESQEVYALT